jgi:hypothetical protein
MEGRMELLDEGRLAVNTDSFLLRLRVRGHR